MTRDREEMQDDTLEACITCGGLWKQTLDESFEGQEVCPKCRPIRHRDWYDSLGKVDDG